MALERQWGLPHESWWCLPVLFGAVLACVFVVTKGRSSRSSTAGSPAARILTQNVRYAADPTSPGEQPWAIRRPLLIKSLMFHLSAAGIDSILCLQEALHHQLLDIVNGLNDASDSPKGDWAYIGVGRDDGALSGEFCPILYRPKVWGLLKWQTVWLSPKPCVPGWDAGCNRIITIALFKHKQTDKTLLLMNTHLDNSGVVARQHSARMICDLANHWAAKYLSSSSWPCIVAGDLNSDAEGDAYKILSEELADTASVCKEAARYGDFNTFTGFGSEQHYERLDYVFVKRDGHYDSVVTAHAVLPNRFDNAIFLSDHRAVLADIASP